MSRMWDALKQVERERGGGPRSARIGLDPFVAARNQAVHAARRSHLAFIVLAAYLAIPVWSTTHEDLLRGTPVILPLLRVGVPILGFYVVVPWLIVFLHFDVLVRLILLSAKLVAFDPSRVNVEGEAEDRARPHLIDGFVFNQWLIGTPDARPTSFLEWVASSMVTFHVRIWVYATIVLLPLVLLLWIQARFLPSHNDAITTVQRLAVCFDLAVLLGFVATIFPRRIRQQDRVIAFTFTEQQVRRWIGRAALASSVAGVLLVSFVVLTFHQEGPAESLRFRIVSLTGRWLQRNLDLTDKTLVRNPVPAEVLAAYHAKGESAEAAWMTHAEGLDLRQRDLRFADFTRANLTNADLRGADLEGAILNEARFAAAKFTADEPSLEDNSVTKSVRLRGARLWRLRAPEAFLDNADLQFADARNADLPGAELQGADFSGADLTFANLQGANLYAARLQGTDVSGVDLRGADLRSAQLQGANFTGARLQGADLRDAQLQGSNLSGAKLDGTDLRGAALWNAHFADTSFHLSDLRGIRIDALPAEERGRIIDTATSIQQSLDGQRSVTLTPIEERLKPALQEGHGAMVTDAPRHDGALYDADGPLAVWGKPVEPGDHRRELAAYLAGIACENAYIARGILRDHRAAARPGSQFTAPVSGDSSEEQMADILAVFIAKDCPSLKRLTTESLPTVTASLAQ